MQSSSQKDGQLPARTGTGELEFKRCRTTNPFNYSQYKRAGFMVSCPLGVIFGVIERVREVDFVNLKSGIRAIRMLARAARPSRQRFQRTARSIF